MNTGPIVISAKLATYTLSVALTKDKKIEAEDTLKQIGIFGAGLAVESLYIEGKGEFFSITNDRKTNLHIQNYIFSLLFQIFGDSLVFDSHYIILKDIINITLAYAVALPIIE
jgi:hypothetical protein